MNSKIKFNVAYIKLSTKTEGPYNRCCIWFQGCNIKCKGCCNKDLQSLVPNHIVTLEELANIVKEAKNKFNIEGITLSGGEPSLQSGLVFFNDEIHKLGLGIIMFSGKDKTELNSELVESVDLLIDGPFIENMIDNKRVLLGSKNKKLSFITNYIFINGD